MSKQMREALEDCVAFITGQVLGPAQRDGIVKEAIAALRQCSPDIVARLRALVILDEVNSQNNLGSEAADEIERLRRVVAFKERVERVRNAAQAAPSREQIAKAVYASWLDADFCTENHFQWFDAGKDNPDSCVHYSNVAKALKVADRILALSSAQRAED